MPTKEVVTSRLEGVSGTVVAWSLQGGAKAIGSPDFLLGVPEHQEEIPALVCMSTSSAEVDGERYFLHPVVTCLARAGMVFEPPLELKFPVGDLESMTSGSETGISCDDLEQTYRTMLMKQFSVWVREEGASEWKQEQGDLVKIDDVFFLQKYVPHFTEYALAQKVKTSDEFVGFADITRLKHESRAHIFVFKNNLAEAFQMFCMDALPSVTTGRSGGFSIGPWSISFQGSRQTQPVESRVMIQQYSLPANEAKSVRLRVTDTNVAWTTVTSVGCRKVTLWVDTDMLHKTGMILLQKPKAREGPTIVPSGEPVKTTVGRLAGWPAL